MTQPGQIGDGGAADVARPWTLCIDIGGTHVKSRVMGPGGEVVGTPVKRPTPRPATPEALLAIVTAIAETLSFDRVSAGFPGVVVGGVTKTAPNLDVGWAGFALGSRLEALLGAPVRLANDADVAGLGVIEGEAVEMMLTLGTGLGAGLYVDGTLVPNLELGHHPSGINAETYEERVGDAVLKRIGEPAWRQRVMAIVEQIRPIWNFRRLYLGGGNARLLRQADMPADVQLVDNTAGVLGALRLWEPAGARLDVVSH
ncbi:MAG: ROK family protein [Deltaproteobacteria bacterium]|nr:MAG: ROK family protein [Deltaproteobacteria bacterium]